MFEIIDPTGRLATSAVSLAPRPASLDGLRVGVFSNGKPNAANLVRAVHQKLENEHRFRGAVVLDKLEEGLFTTGAPDWMLEQLAACDVVIHGSGD